MEAFSFFFSDEVFQQDLKASHPTHGRGSPPAPTHRLGAVYRSDSRLYTEVMGSRGEAAAGVLRPLEMKCCIDMNFDS